MRIVAAIIFLALLAGCMSRPSPLAKGEEQDLFFRGLEELRAGGPAQAFAELQSRHPASPWTEKARLVMDIVAGRDGQIGQARRQLQQERSRCSRENEALTQENRQLREDLAKLKALVIEMEKRAR